MNHYYQNNENLKSNIRLVEYTFRGTKIKLDADNGVFSKDRVDFGTNVLLNSLEFSENCKSVLDVGCGYGVIGISIASHFKDMKVTMVDVNDRAIELVNKNIYKNKCLNANCLKSSLYEKIDSSFDMIISNPPIRAGKNIVHGVVVDGYNHLNEGGSIWVVIQKKQGAPSMMAKMEEVFGNVEVVNKESGYFILKSVK